MTARDSVLHIGVRDDGRGGADLTSGSGLAGLKDRAEALGGQISLHSAPGTGTGVQVSLPLDGPSGTSLMDTSELSITLTISQITDSFISYAEGIKFVSAPEQHL
ncbi:MAG TPA: hypothetical protein VE733_00845 [Streptosporangiaceae bacterium]|nr:hypothetical protein [Streptosporangiaceae bacterium]